MSVRTTSTAGSGPSLRTASTKLIWSPLLAPAAGALFVRARSARGVVDGAAGGCDASTVTEAAAALLALFVSGVAELTAAAMV